MKLVPAFRRFLKKPLGKLVSASKAVKAARKSGRLVVAVGDVTALLFFAAGIQPGLSVVDLRVRRKPLHAKGIDVLRKAAAKKLFCSNAAGSISMDSLRKIKSAFRLVAEGKRVVLFVRGEEDLLFLPAVLHAPAGSLLFYGQPGKGVVVLRATVGEKKRIQSLVEKAFRD